MAKDIKNTRGPIWAIRCLLAMSSKIPWSTAVTTPGSSGPFRGVPSANYYHSVSTKSAKKTTKASEPDNNGDSFSDKKVERNGYREQDISAAASR